MATAEYFPSVEHASKFWKEQSSKKSSAPRVPDGFPEQLTSPLAWTRAEIESKRSKWTLHLDEGDIKAIEAALASFEARSFHLSQISAETFVLPNSLAQHLKDISGQCYHGIGFSTIHGLDPTRYSPEQNVAIFAGIAAHIAPQRGFLDRDYQKVLCHVVNAAGNHAEGKTRSPGFTNGPLSFHSDNCEILALYALDIAPEGGRTLISSSWQLYNDLAKKRPDVLQTLAQDWVLDTFQDYTKHPPFTVPFLHNINGEKALFRFSRYPITGFESRKRNPALPAPTQTQVEALDAVQFMAAENAIPLPMKKGDLVFINDMVLFHARESFDEAGAHLQRHLLKMSIRDPAQNWPVPSTAKQAWRKMYGPNREDGTRKDTWSTRFAPGDEEGLLTNG